MDFIEEYIFLGIIIMALSLLYIRVRITRKPAGGLVARRGGHLQLQCKKQKPCRSTVFVAGLQPQSVLRCRRLQPAPLFPPPAPARPSRPPPLGAPPLIQQDITSLRGRRHRASAAKRLALPAIGARSAAQ